MCCFPTSPSRLRRATSPIEERPWHSGKAFPLRQRLPSVGATATTAASGGNRESLLGQRPARRKQCAADAGSRNSALSSEARLRGLLKYKKIRQQTSFLLGRMLPYPWCHLNYRHNVPVTLCALPVESTAAITSGARLPLLPAMPQHPGVQGEAHGGSFRPGHLRGSHLPALSGRGRSGPYFSRSSLFMQKLYHCFLSVSTSAQQFLQVCAACPSSASFAAQLRHKPYKTLPSHCSVKPCSAIRWARTSSMKWQSR